MSKKIQALSNDTEEDIQHFTKLLEFIETQKLPRVVADYCVDLARNRKELAVICDNYFNEVDKI
jgi:hypothetical protein